jgi:branched-chain amino acid transport system substrate-binding protein
MDMRNSVLRGVIVIVALVMAGCAPAAPAAAPTSPRVSAPVGTTAPAASATSAPAPKTGSTSGDSIKIGLTTALSGPVAASGQQQRMAAQLALDQFNAQGGVNGKNVELLVEDNACNPTEGVNAANKLIAERVSAMLDGVCSSVTLAVMPVIDKAGVSYVVGNATSPLIRQQSGVAGNKWTFRINPDDAAIAPTMASYLKKSGDFKKVSIVAEDTDYGQGGARTFAEALIALGIEVPSRDFYPQGTTDFTTIFNRIQRENPDAIGFYGLGADGINFARQYVRSGLKIPITGKPPLDEWNGQGLLANGALDGSMGPNPQSNVMDSPQNLAYVKAFRDKYNAEPIIQAFEGYQQANIVADAIKRAGSAEPAAVREALLKTSYPSMLAPDVKLEFDDHNQAHDVIGIFRVVNSLITVAGYERT